MNGLKAKDGSYLHTVRFPSLKQSFSKTPTIVFFHSFGAYMEKNYWIAQHFQKVGYDVIGIDMRGFGQTESKYPGLINDPSI